MAEPEEVDLTKALSMLGQRLKWLARDIFLGMDSPEQCEAMAALLDEASRQIRERAGIVVVVAPRELPPGFEGGGPS